MRQSPAVWVLVPLIVVFSAGLAAQDGLRAAQPPEPELPESTTLEIPGGDFEGPIRIPSIARYRLLPQRMDMAPFLQPAVTNEVVRLRDLELLDRVLRESDEPEMLQVAALSLAKVATDEGTNLSQSVDILRKHAESSDHWRIRYACALALIQGDCKEAAQTLVTLSQDGDESLRRLTDPALARWKVAAAVPIWRTRFADPQCTYVSFRLACEGLSALGQTEDIDDFIAIASNESEPFIRRAACASAIAQLDAVRALKTAELVAAGTEADRLIATFCLASEDPACQERLAQFCTDPADSVAARAWTTLQSLNGSLLLTHIPSGRGHRDAVIRMTAARTMKDFINPEYCGWLSEMVSDVHIQVRNVAREMLISVAAGSDDLKQQMIDAAVSTISGNADDWQGIEQSLIILAQLRARQFAPAIVPLLRHDRPEVLVTAAWILHLFPDADIAVDALTILPERQQLLLSGQLPGRQDPEDIGLQMGFLFQLAGLLKLDAQQATLDAAFSKSDPGGEKKRAAAMWALGVMHADTGDANLARQLEGRVNDRDPFLPERESIRLKAAIGIGFLKSTSSISTIETAYKLDDPTTLIPTAAWLVLPRLGATTPEKPNLVFERVRAAGRKNPSPLED